MDRRKFLKLLIGFFSSAAIISFIYPLLRFLSLPYSEAKAKKTIIKKADVPIGEAKNIVFNNAPAIVFNRTEKGLIALSKVCTHLGCIVEYDKDKNRLLCPCHAGVYDLEGNVLSGPPPKPLLKLPLKVEDENIVIG